MEEIIRASGCYMQAVSVAFDAEESDLLVPSMAANAGSQNAEAWV